MIPSQSMPAPMPSSHVFLTPYRTKADGGKYRYSYNVHEYNPYTNTIGRQLVDRSFDPEFDTCRILAKEGVEGALCFWRNPRNYAIKIKDITKSAQLKTEENATVDLRVSKHIPMSEEQKAALRAKS